ncbi:MAG: hypothetical protein HC880_00185 [Bacteroidia bacterium]|nr:hypothetical protein [Bacteroidia bacterium]
MLFRSIALKEVYMLYRIRHCLHQKMGSRARFKVSVNDLKVISSALLYYKKFLIKKKDFDKAEVVAEVDDRIYRLILALEKEFLMEEEQVNA